MHFSLADMASGAQAKGRTVAELGAMNQPLDMVAFTQGGDEYLLIAHSTHPLMKIACSDIDTQEALTEPQEPRGVPRDELDVPGREEARQLQRRLRARAATRRVGTRHLRSLKTASL